MNFETLNVALADGVVTVELNRPDKANAMSQDMWRDIRSVFRWVDETPEARVAYFSVKEIDVGMTADVGTLQRLPKLVPDGIARELAYTGRRFDAAEAKEIGLVNRVYDSAESLREGVAEIAATIAAKSPLS